MPFRHRLMLKMRPVLRYVRTRILHVDDEPERMARGIATGLFVGFLPLMGIQMFIAYFLAQLLKANKVMAMLFVWISNPFTLIIVYYPCYLVGRFLLAPRNKPQIGSEELEQVIESTFSLNHILSDMFTLQFWSEVYSFASKIGLEILVGGIVIGFVCAKAGYWTSLVVIKRYRRRKHYFLQKLALRRLRRHSGAR